MMSPVLILAAGVLTVQAPADVGIAAFGDACLARTPVSREALAELAARRGWPVGRTDTPDNLEWRDIYRAGGVMVRLDQHRESDDNPGERICVVLIGSAPNRWRDQVAKLAANGSPVGAPAIYDTERYQLPPGLELTVWDLPDGSRIHALREPDNTLELSVNYPTGR